MPGERLLIRALRREDLLDLTFELVNLQAEGSPARLARVDAGAPALVIVHFPPQHLAEAVFQEGQEAGPPVGSMLAGPSRLAFQLPDDENGWPLTLSTLLDWRRWRPVLAPNALPPEATEGPGVAEPAADVTALEIPTGLVLSPDARGSWQHAVDPVEHGGRVELWHTRLASAQAMLRAIWAPDIAAGLETSLTQAQRRDIARLSSDFGLPRLPADFMPHLVGNPMRVLRWRAFLAHQGMPLKYVPRPIRAERLMLSMLGSWARLDSAWDYPTIIRDKNDRLGYPLLALEQWQHVAAQGRDQFVKTVEKAFLCDTGHRASVVTITERQFRPFVVRTETTPQGRVAIFGANAILRQHSYIQLQEPVKDYRPLAAAYRHGGREMPFERIEITTRTTPPLDAMPKDQAFWPRVRGEPFRFQLLARDREGRNVHLERPLMCIPLRALLGPGSWADAGPWQAALARYHQGGGGDPPTLGLRTVDLGGQTMAFAETEPAGAGKAALETRALVFEAQPVEGERIAAVPNEHPLFLPMLAEADVALPAVERLLGRTAATTIRLDPDFLAHGFDPGVNLGEVFATLKAPLPLPFAAEKAGGLVKPDMAIGGLSRAMGPVADPGQIKAGRIDTAMFEQVRLLGGLALKDILAGAPGLDLASLEVAELGEAALEAKLADRTFRLEAPLLTSRVLEAEKVAETRFLWKPAVTSKEFGVLSFLAGDETQLVLQARIVTPLDGKPGSFKVVGRLERFALDFAGALKLDFAILSFKAENGRKPDVSADGLELTFQGPLAFVQTLKSILPADGFNDPPYLDVTPSGIRAGYTLGVPTVGVGVFSLQNINLSAGLSLPFVDQPMGVRFAISERHQPFLVTVGIFGGGGFFALALTAKGIEQIEAAIEFGGNVSLNLGVASGGVFVMAGIYFGLTGDETRLTGYLRCGGFLSVLGIVSISVEFYLGFTYREKAGGGGEAWGQASLTVKVEIACFSKSVVLTVERRFAGAAGDPTFAQLVEPDDWSEYCAAFA